MGNERPTLYIGITNDLVRRVNEHRQGMIEGFTKQYRLEKLLYYEECRDCEEAILREKHLKKWNRQWKIDLIQEMNPEFRDLYEDIVG
jgi:putative endonuclease